MNKIPNIGNNSTDPGPQIKTPNPTDSADISRLKNPAPESFFSRLVRGPIKPRVEFSYKDEIGAMIEQAKRQERIIVLLEVVALLRDANAPSTVRELLLERVDMEIKNIQEKIK